MCNSAFDSLEMFMFCIMIETPPFAYLFFMHVDEEEFWMDGFRTFSFMQSKHEIWQGV